MLVSSARVPFYRLGPAVSVLPPEEWGAKALERWKAVRATRTQPQTAPTAPAASTSAPAVPAVKTSAAQRVFRIRELVLVILRFVPDGPGKWQILIV
jgi:hypothetical protein